MSDLSHSISQGSAPVAIILALALAATVGVSAQSWDVKVAAKGAAASDKDGTETASRPGEEQDGASLLRVLVDWARGRPGNCASPPPGPAPAGAPGSQ